MGKSGAVKDLEQLEADIANQAKRVNEFQHASISNGYSNRGDEYDRKKREAEKILIEMNIKYQKKLNQASKILKNL